VRIVGTNHLKASVFNQDNPSVTFDMIAFNFGEWFDYIYCGNPFNICYHVEENEWNGISILQLNVKDIKTCN
jgi:single-stranded-DNA-specific exonuclease